MTRAFRQRVVLLTSLFVGMVGSASDLRAATSKPLMPRDHSTRQSYLSPALVIKKEPDPIPSPQCLPEATTRSKIKHLVVIVQENHSFDSYFGNYCQAPTGSDPLCGEGPGCCEAAPQIEPNSGAHQTVLDDFENIIYDPDHSESCELSEMNGGKMDHFAFGATCSNPKNFAFADPKVIAPYLQYAKQYALADRYFQPIAGASSANDMYLARASYVFGDNEYVPDSIGTSCYLSTAKKTFTDPTVGDLLSQCSVPWAFYAEGYRFVLANPKLPLCTGIVYDPGDNPFQYFASTRDNLTYMKDTDDLSLALKQGTLPSVSYVKALEINSEHPVASIGGGVDFVTNIVSQILSAPDYRDNTLILLTADESGGFYDHISPPPTNPADGQAYGPRTYLLALGPFAKSNYVSHVTMEHSSIARFIEWNFLDGVPGQLHTRDGNVNNIGDLLDADKTGTLVPAN